MLDVVDILATERVSYAVVGALAASVHGAVRASMDADLLLFVGVQAAAGLSDRIQQAGFRTELRHGDLEDPIPALLRVHDQHDNRVDLLLGLRGMEHSALERVIHVPFQGASRAFIGRDLVRRFTTQFGRGASESLQKLLC